MKQCYIIIAVDQKVCLIPYNKHKSNNHNIIGKTKYILNCNQTINQIKLMENKENDKFYLIALENSGLMYTKLIKYERNSDKIIEDECKVYDCRINFNDNSIWSLACYYPYIAVGGNNKIILVHNIETSSANENEPIKHSLLIPGNNHNVPYVTFSPDGEFIGSSSIDKIPKIFDIYTGKCVKTIQNDSKQWYL